MNAGTENVDVDQLVEDLANAIARGDDGDFDSPAWENERRLVGLQARLADIVRRRRAALAPGGAEPSPSPFDPG